MVMDAAQVVEMEALALQAPMNEIIDLGESEIQRHYEGSTVLISGATGFMGKLLLEKLLRSCKINTIYILVREKKGKNIQERLDFILTDPLFDTLRAKKPNFTNKIIPITGKMDEMQLGIAEENLATITNEVDHIFHLAATTRFNEPLRLATLINVRGTREILKLGVECKKLRSFVHVSTAYSTATRNLIKSEIREQFYPSPIAPDALIQLAESVDEGRLKNITNGLTDGWPNTYAFTKMVAEELIRQMSGSLPVCIVRPPVVVPTYCEPTPGWLDKNSIMGPSGLFLGAGLGVLHVLYCKDVKVYFIPGDCVTNATITAGWDTAVRAENGSTETKIYTMSSIRSTKECSWGLLTRVIRSTEMMKIATPEVVGPCGVIETDNAFLYWLLTWFLHYIPVYILEAVFFVLNLKKPKEIPSFIRIYQKIYDMGKIYSYFLLNEWYMHDGNTEELYNKMSSKDKAIFNFDIHSIDWKKLLLVWAVGLRKYIVKDGLRNSDYGYKKTYILKKLGYAALALYTYVVYKIVAITVTVMLKYFE